MAASPTPSPTPGVPVTEFGATDGVWNSHHTPVPGFTAGTAYDADPTLTDESGAAGARFVVVQHMYGHVMGYYMNLHQMTLDQAKTVAVQEFPSDAKVLWFAEKNGCDQMEVQSDAVGQALATENFDPQGEVLIEFDTQRSDAPPGLDPSDVNHLVIETGVFPDPVSAAGCSS